MNRKTWHRSKVITFNSSLVINCNVCHAFFRKHLSITTPCCRKIWPCTPCLNSLATPLYTGSLRSDKELRLCIFRMQNTIVHGLRIDLRTTELKGRVLLYYWENIKGLDAKVVAQTFDVLHNLSLTWITQGPIMTGPGGKCSNL